ncbi:MAG: transporter [Sphingomonadaceae bacterium]|nr:transporter [Sphingomonadaceae bacterium]
MKRLLPLALAIASSAFGEDRDFCSDRPGQATPPCTMEAGHAIFETGLIDWTRQSDPMQRSDTILYGDTLLRLGVADSAEVQLEWTPWGHQRVRDKASGAVMRSSGTGDVTFGVQRGLAGPNGPVALKAFVTFPTGGDAIGQQTWSAGAVIPAAFDLSKSLQLGLTAEAEAAANASGSGRHLAFSGVAGLGFKLTEAVQLTVDAALLRDDDPSGETTQATGGASIAWQAGKNTQLDVGTVAGLNRDSPDIEIYAGFSRRF